MKNKEKKIILIAEDEVATLTVLADKLRDQGYEVLKAEDGEVALQKALNAHPDLILLDIVMPKQDGIKTLEKLRQDKWGKDANVMLLSNLNDSASLAQAVIFGVKDYLVKSDWSLDEVVKKIEEKLARNVKF
ncbi:MAG: response regulator [Patescibacteria group bacterium]